MDVDFQLTRDHALIALIAEEVEQLPDDGNRSLGRTALQKMLYFLQVFGVPMRYRFDVHHYGPFCAQVLSDADLMTYVGAIEDKSQKPDKFSNYCPGPAGGDLIRRFSSELEPYRECIHDLVNALGQWSPTQLELLATLHYSYRELEVSIRGIPTKHQVIERFKEFKADKFDNNEIDEVYDCLVNAKLIKPRTA